MILLHNVIFSIFIQLYINKCFELVFDTFIEFSWSLRPAKQQDPIDVRTIWKLLKCALPTPLIWFTSTNTFSSHPQIHLIYLHKYIWFVSTNTLSSPQLILFSTSLRFPLSPLLLENLIMSFQYDQFWSLKSNATLMIFRCNKTMIIIWSFTRILVGRKAILGKARFLLRPKSSARKVHIFISIYPQKAKI